MVEEKEQINKEEKGTKTEKETNQEKQEEKKEQEKHPGKKEKKAGKKAIKKKEFAIVNAKDLPISTKQSVAICNMIRRKKVGEAIILLENVLKKKLAVPVKGEIPHRKRGHRLNKSLSGRYPEKAVGFFIKILKNLSANASVNGMDNENIIISMARANKASKPTKPTRIAYGRKKFKRTHVVIMAKEMGAGEDEKEKIEKETRGEKTEDKEKKEENKEKEIKK